MTILRSGPGALVALSLSLALASEGTAQVGIDLDVRIAQCASIESSVDRLECYDRLATDTSPAVTREEVSSAPWLIGLGDEPESIGVISGFGNSGAVRASTFGPSDVARVSMPTPARVGTVLQAFRVERTIAGAGQVVVPTAVMEVAALGNGFVGAVVTSMYERVLAGDLVRPLPAYNLLPGDVAQAISGGSEALLMGFADGEAVGTVGDIAFLDVGATDGIKVGDEFAAYGEVIARVEAELLVVGVTDNRAAAKIGSISAGGSLRAGLVVRLIRKMR